MDAKTRREAVLEYLKGSVEPVSASALAGKFAVSRQIIVGDVAILRAEGAEISATPRGYLLPRETGQITRQLACCHSAQQMEEELNIIVDNGCTVRDVVVEHPIYGQLTGRLELRSRYDVRQFVRRAAREDAAPLSSLTDGIHLHTVLCPDEAAFERIKRELGERGMLVKDEP